MRRLESQHLWALLLLALSVYVAHIRINLHNISNHQSVAYVEKSWSQPASVDVQYALAIGNQTWSISFSNTEQLLWTFKNHTAKPWVVDHQTRNLLQNIADDFPEIHDAKDIERLKTLIEKTLPDEGNTISNLVESYIAYHRNYTQSLETISTAEPELRIQLLKDSLSANSKRQVNYFGADIASALFKRQNETTQYLIEKQIINIETLLLNNAEDKK